MGEKKKIQSFRDLIVWQRARELVADLYRITAHFPQNEMYGLVSQMRRAGISIPSNIAEGFYRKGAKEKIQFLRIAYGSGGELETQVILASDLKFIDAQEQECLNQVLQEIMSMLNKVIEGFEKKL